MWSTEVQSILPNSKEASYHETWDLVPPKGQVTQKYCKWDLTTTTPPPTLQEQESSGKFWLMRNRKQQEGAWRWGDNFPSLLIFQWLLFFKPCLVLSLIDKWPWLWSTVHLYNTSPWICSHPLWHAKLGLCLYCPGLILLNEEFVFMLWWRLCFLRIPSLDK